MMLPTGSAIVAGVAGWPVGHSLSPALHGYWLKKHEINGIYLPFAVKPEDFQDFLKFLPRMGVKGINVTVPHKESAMKLVDILDETAQAIGAVNTITVENGKLHGSNTDAEGFLANLNSKPWKKDKAVVIGAGGAAKAICAALKQEGVKEIILINRTKEKAEAIAKPFGAQVMDWQSRALALEAASLLVNTTTQGMKGEAPLDLDLAMLPQSALVTDIVYRPLETPLLASAKARGHPVLDGIGMLLHQARPGFRAWFGVDPNVDEGLREAVLALC